MIFGFASFSVVFGMKKPLLQRLFELLGRLCFPRQPEWQQGRSAKIMTAAVALGLILGVVIVLISKHMNRLSG